MGISAFRQQIDVAKSALRGEARTAMMVEAARTAFTGAQAQNRSALGYDPAFRQIVDGRQGAPIEGVRPGGTIVYLFAVGTASLQAAVDDGIEIIMRIGPVKTGRYLDANMMLVNRIVRSADREVNATAGGAIEFAETDVVSLVNLLPYARKVERGASDQAPNGVYEVAYAALRSRYGNILKIDFSWERYPGFEIGTSRSGGRLKSRADVDRAARYPTITLSLK